ncbi:hypothetical protein Tmar_1594 [Thermaerobacter marianensis DSM 12885]|uniref:EfeO-type cupredoxin-like domain-containing protein n=1 Tax=Thermaerobacter marianensis (strain ATCC 700841 / DSM 12885 / JCM 10246 / 7p75a) TaxID=644966 RepID=E6SH39_THEM7|nr:hypothetical protein [Thermaerobacter marianensis]ADU51703.1 hypothetical protein Tmar_1594 [Thermaerobacter marianensis DSM 12885]
MREWCHRAKLTGLLTAGAVLLSACASQVAGSPENPVQKVELRMGDYWFNPGQLVVRAGDTVTITVVNDSRERREHEFMVGRQVMMGGPFGDRPDGFMEDFFDGVEVELLEAEGVTMLMPGEAKVTGEAAEALMKAMGGMGGMPGMEGTGEMGDMGGMPGTAGMGGMDGHGEGTEGSGGSATMDGGVMGGGSMNGMDGMNGTSGGQSMEGARGTSGTNMNGMNSMNNMNGMNIMGDMGGMGGMSGMGGMDGMDGMEGMNGDGIGGMEGMAMGGDAHAGFMIQLEPGGRATFTIKIPEGKAGRWEFACFAQDGQHYGEGMKGTLVVVE